MRKPVALLAFLLLAACAKHTPPTGRWEGGYDGNGVLVAARVEVEPDGSVRVSAPDLTNIQGTPSDEMRQGLAAKLATAWDDVEPRPFDFDGTTFRKQGGVAPQMVWDKNTNQMTLEIYIGMNPALPVPLRPVDNFHDNPWPSG